MENVLAVVVPMFNEELNAEKCIRTMLSEIQKLSGVALFVVNDGSQDQTKTIVQKMYEENPIWPLHFINQPENRGYGAACLEGARQARLKGFRFALFMDSDLTNDPKLIQNFLKIIRSDQYDLIKASRYIPGGGMTGVPFYRQQITIWGNRLASHLFGMGIHDCTNGFRAVRLSLLSELQFRERGFPSIVEELYELKKRGARCTETPYILTAREKEEGKSKFTYSVRTVLTYLKYALLASGVRKNPK